MESGLLEYKREYTDSVKYAVCAFANTDGGRVLIGVDDDGTPRGLRDPEGDLLRVTNLIRDSIKPDITVFTEARTVELESGAEHRLCIEVEVRRGTLRPYYLTGKGIRSEGVYVRQGASSVPASDAAILSMIRETAGDRFEDAVSVEQDLDLGDILARLRAKGLEGGHAQLRTLGLVSESGSFTQLARLFSPSCPFEIRAAVFSGGEKGSFRDRREFRGPLIRQTEDAYGFLDRYNALTSRLEGIERVDVRDYPEEALREALLNCVVHRDYALSAPVLISVFDDRIEFLSPGGLVPGLSFDDMMLGISAPRNRKLAEIFYRLDLIEAYGTGLAKIRRSYAGCSRQPLIEVTSGAFKLTLPNRNLRGYADDAGSSYPGIDHMYLSDNAAEYGASGCEAQRRGSDRYFPRSRAVMELIREKGEISRRDVEKVCGISQATAVLLLRRMIEDGIIEASGSGRSLRYVPRE